MCQLSTEEACWFLAARQNGTYSPDQAQSLAAGPVVAMELMAASGIRKWLDALGKSTLLPGLLLSDEAGRPAMHSETV
jgi:hypothetical protein